jgi:hypothetical protein
MSWPCGPYQYPDIRSVISLFSSGFSFNTVLSCSGHHLLVTTAY